MERARTATAMPPRDTKVPSSLFKCWIKEDIPRDSLVAATWGLFTTKMFIRVLEGPRLEVSEMVGKVIGKTIFSGKAHNLRRAKDSSRYFALWGRHFDSKTKKLVGLCFHSREESSAFMERILQEVPCRCVSNFDFRKEKEEDLALSVGMLLHVLKKFESGWWFGVDPNHQLGLFPSNYVTEVLDQRAQPSNKDKDENSTCCICMEGVRVVLSRRPTYLAKDALVLPCGHLCMCVQCAKQLHQRTALCPVCRGPITQVIKAYIV